jgi:uncharacterized Zn-binding protein involved in type VI secretion
MPAAARITDFHSCPMVNPGPVPHVGGPVSAGCGTVIIGYQPAARVGDAAVCVPGTDTISQGDSSVLIGHKPAARMGDPTSHGGVVAAGCPTVIIGGSPQTLDTGKPFCEDCEKLKKKQAAKAKKQKARS